MHGATHVEATRSREAAPQPTCSTVLQPGGECVMSIQYSTVLYCSQGVNVLYLYCTVLHIFCTVLQPGGECVHCFMSLLSSSLIRHNMAPATWGVT